MKALQCGHYYSPFVIEGPVPAAYSLALLNLELPRHLFAL